jgi:hypothetical protein
MLLSIGPQRQPVVHRWLSLALNIAAATSIAASLLWLEEQSSSCGQLKAAATQKAVATEQSQA